MKTSLPYFLITLILWSCSGQDIPDKEFQITGALMAAPEELREGAKVLGFDKNGKMVTLRHQRNDMRC